MATKTVTDFRVKAATNGFTLCYEVKTKSAPTAGQTYGNTEWTPVEKVFSEAEKDLLLAEVKTLLGIIEDGADKEAAGAEIVMSKDSKY